MDIQNYQFFKRLIDTRCIEQIILFGSRARCDDHDRADIDLAIYCPQATDADWLAVLDIIDEADTLLNIDCIRLDALHDASNLKHEIMQQGVKLYDRLQNRN